MKSLKNKDRIIKLITVLIAIIPQQNNYYKNGDNYI